MVVSDTTRRRLLRLGAGGAVLALAGCSGGDGDDEELPEGVSQEEFDHGPVPEAYRTARSQADEERVVANLVTKASVKFQEASEAVDAGLAAAGNDCGSCAEYIPDKNGDGFGACAKVEGYVDPEDWCALWESIESEQTDA